MDQSYLPFRFSSSPPPSSSLSLNSNILATENINHLGHYNNNSNSSNINSAAMMKMASANVINNGGFLGLMSEMDRIENHHHQGNVNGSTTTPTSVSQNISLENTTSPNNNNNNKLGLTSMSSKKCSSSSSTSKGQKKVRKPRYAFQTRSQVDILDDGYRWRKYGQKAVKNNKFPRYAFFNNIVNK